MYFPFAVLNIHVLMSVHSLNEILNAAGTLLSADSARKDKEKNTSLKFAQKQILL